MTQTPLHIAPVASAIRQVRSWAYKGVVVPGSRLLDRFDLMYPIILDAQKKLDAQRPIHAYDGYQPTEHDVFVCAYGKSGNNLLMQITHQIAQLGDGEFDHIYHVVPWADKLVNAYTIPLDDPSILRGSPTGLRVIRNVLYAEYLPFDPSARYIYIMRNPKEVLVSAYYHHLNVGRAHTVPSVETWMKLFCTPHFPFGGSWVKHVAGYWDQRDLSNFLLLNFHTLRHNRGQTIKQIAKFMGVGLTTEAFDKVCHKSSFEYMKANDHKFHPGKAPYPWVAKQGNFIRNGKTGQADELLTPQQQAYIDDYCRAEFKRLGSKFPYDSWFGGSNG